MNEIVMIEMSKLAHHPDNPRKDLGDLKDLSASIKAQGILQNLTVMPSGKGAKKPYWVVIGNRRFEAAKAAGLKELPCRIVEMDEKEALKTMMSENMQRTDLTVLDQVQGIGKMQQLGMTLPEIAAKLPKKELEAACDKGATLFDLLEITKLEDPEDQVKVLSNIGTNNFNYSITNAVRNQNMKKWRAEFLPKLEAKYPKARKCRDNDRWSDIWTTVFTWRFDTRGEPEPIPEPEEGVKYGIAADDVPWNITLMKIDDKAKKAKAEEKENREWMKMLKEEARRLNNEAAELRYSFIRKFRLNSEKERTAFWQSITGFIYRNKAFMDGYGSCSFSGNLAREILCIPAEHYEERRQHAGETFDHECERRGVHPDAALLAWAVSGGVCGGASYSMENYVSDYNGHHVESEELDKVYELLTICGYKMSDFEKSLQKGTHPFIKNPQKYFKEKNNG